MLGMKEEKKLRGKLIWKSSHCVFIRDSSHNRKHISARKTNSAISYAELYPPPIEMFNWRKRFMKFPFLNKCRPPFEHRNLIIYSFEI